MARTLLLSVSCTAVLALVAFHHVVDDAHVLTAALHALSGWLSLGALVPLGLAVGWRRRRWVAGTALVASVALWPLLQGHGGTPALGGVPLRVASANVLMVNDRYDAVIAELVASDPDVIVLQEVNPDWAEALATDERLGPWGWHHIVPLDGSFGYAVLSRIPARFGTEDLLGVPMGVVMLEVGEREVELLAVHTLPPRTAELTERWHAQMAHLATRPCDILAGDLNATRHHPSYRRLLGTRLRYAHAQVGRASASTWPRRAFPVPPMRLDHVLVGDGVEVAAVWELPANGSDHAPVVADLRLP